MRLLGTMFITGDLNVIGTVDLRTSRIVTMDEDNILNSQSKEVIGGTCLLPPIEAKQAEADGDEERYNIAYASSLGSPFQRQFVMALIAYLYRGGNIVIFLPEEYNNTANKLVYFLTSLYGIHPGIIGDPDPIRAGFSYDAIRFGPMWADALCLMGVISPMEFLYIFPIEIPLQLGNPPATNMLLDELKPYGFTLDDRLNELNRLKQEVHMNPRIIPAIHSI